MDRKIGLFAGLTALLAMGSAQAACPSDPVYGATNDATGHVFEVYQADGITWAEAADCADNNSVGVATGHLATITSASENEWIINSLLSPALPLTFVTPPTSRTQVWVGGYQESGFGEPSGGWRWVNNEGPFSGSNGNPDYTNWATSEPNNSGGYENNLTVGRYPDNLYGWNDEGAALSSIGGFIVEYDVPRTAACTPGSTDPTLTCQTIDGQTLIFPTSSTTGGKTIKFTAYEFTDPRVDGNGDCTTRQMLSLFTDSAFNDVSNPPLSIPQPLKIPAYLCGSPKFVVVAVDSSQLEILKGVVVGENETTETVLPGNLYKCWDPIIGQLGPDFTRYFADPQRQDVGVWQTKKPTEMAENATTTPPDYVGAATEVTSFCGTTGIKTRGASYFVIGLHIDFNLGPKESYPANKGLIYAEFVKLTQYKLSLLRDSVDQARLYGSVKKPDWQAMSSQLKNAISKLGAGDPAGALSSMQQFVFKVNSSIYSPPTGAYTGFNFNGDHLMRGENIVFTLRVKVVPYKPVP